MPITFNKDLILYNNNEVGSIRRNYNNDNYCAYLRSENFVTGYNTDNLEKILARMKKIGAVKNNNHIIFKANKFSQYEIYKLHNYIGFIQMPSLLFYNSSYAFVSISELDQIICFMLSFNKSWKKIGL